MYSKFVYNFLYTSFKLLNSEIEDGIMDSGGSGII
jgi:hypothetical protein